MATKVVVHSTFKRFVQVIGFALVIAAALTGLKKLANGNSTESLARAPALVSTHSAAKSSVIIDPNLIVGRSSVVDADTLEIHGTRVRLDGVDAPESSQRCGAVGQEWACGQQAALALSEWIGGKTVSCKLHGADRYQRKLVRCTVDGQDMQAWLVSNGWAMAYRRYSTDYVAAEEVAKSAKLGLWRGEFVTPWEWRTGQRTVEP